MASDKDRKPESQGDEIMSEAIALDTPGQIAAWHLSSRMFQIALEINTGMKHSRGPILQIMYREGLLDQPYRGTMKNKQIVLRACVETMQEALPGWEIPNSIARALAKEA